METLQNTQKSFTVDDKFESFLDLVKEGDSDSDDGIVHTSDEESSDDMTTDDEIDWAASDVESENCDIIVDNLETDCIPPSSNSSVHVSNHKNSCERNRKLLGSKNSSKEHSKQSSCAGQVEEINVFECGVCWKRFEGKYKLCMHMREHSGEGSYACQTCDKAFRGKRALEHHQCPNQHDSDKNDVIFKCSICGKKYPDNNKFRHHINLHKGISYTGSICKGTYTHPQTLKVHMKVHKSADGNRKSCLSCDICEKVFVSKDNLRTHMKSHELSLKEHVEGYKRKDKKIENQHKRLCKRCGKHFSYKSNLRRHIRNVHEIENQRKFTCKRCGKHFSDRSNMYRHIKNVHKIGNQRKYTCKRCGELFLNKYNLIRHIRYVHKIDLDFYREMDSYSVVDRPQNMDNVKDDHRTLTQSFVCEVCHLSFARKYDLKRHVLIHTDEKCYPCSLCPCAYRQSTGLIRHMAWHRGDYTCKYCQKKYTRKYHLQLHVSKHEHSKQLEEI